MGLGAGLTGYFPWSLQAGRRDGIRLTIMHTNDTHGRIDPFPGDAPEYAGMGGVARRSTLIRQVRDENPNCLLLDAGDVFQGTPYFNEYNGALDFRIMSRMGYDACNIGNHEFDNGVQGLRNVADHATFPLVSSNYNFANTPMGGIVQEYVIKKKGGLKIGIFGLGIDFQNLVSKHLREGVRYTDPLSVSREAVSILRNDYRCDMVICLSHLGFEYSDSRISDRVIAGEVDGIDLIVGGHTHTFLDRPERITRPDGRNTVITQAGFGGIILGRIDFQFNERKQITATETMNSRIG